ncbi:MAG: phage tail sheath subtilisin-like domain-containing protein [Patiriisocius sp.]|uniref:phage tail sheath subtilisin-like domain-containing protein n=1 Tax=Patiriisocius sp. TaxID=2822396 RepID=UPI003EF3D5DF
MTQKIHEGLVAVSPMYVDLIKAVCLVFNLLPPSAAMVGVYTMVDATDGVWKAPANTSLNSVVKLSVQISNEDQANLNVDAANGKSINAIRNFPGRGILVWGARTLDGNSNDWRYINVRRTIMMIE